MKERALARSRTTPAASPDDPALPPDAAITVSATDELTPVSLAPADVLACAEQAVTNLTRAVTDSDWDAAGRFDRALAQALTELDLDAAELQADERQTLIARLRDVQTVHSEAMQSLVAERDSVGNELAEAQKAREAIHLYTESSGS